MFIIDNTIFYYYFRFVTKNKFYNHGNNSFKNGYLLREKAGEKELVILPFHPRGAGIHDRCFNPVEHQLSPMARCGTRIVRSFPWGLLLELVSIINCCFSCL